MAEHGGWPTGMSADEERLELLRVAAQQAREGIDKDAVLSDEHFLELKKMEMGFAVTQLAAEILEDAAFRARAAILDPGIGASTG